MSPNATVNIFCPLRQPAAQKERLAALTVVLASALTFLVIAPLAKLPLPAVPTFIATYQSALVINDVLTAAFLFSQFAVLRSRPLLLVANAYLFTALMVLVHTLSFPGLFSSGGLIGGNEQTTAWLYMFWHAGFPLFILIYAVQGYDQPDGSAVGRRDGLATCISLAVTAVAVGTLTVLSTAGIELLPTIMDQNRYTPAMNFVVGSVWLLSLAALAALWRRRPLSVLDLWLMAVLCIWLCDIALSAILNGGRFDLGFYAGRIYGLIATCLVLTVLIVESGLIYARLLAAHSVNLQLTAELQKLSSIDALTGIANRRVFEQALDQEWRRTLRHRTPLCLLMLDVDCFKQFNDTYGHVAGDGCLQKISKSIADNARRAGEVAARYGGEEFVVLLPHTRIEEAVRLAEQICRDVRDLRIPHERSVAADHVTISIGVACALNLILDAAVTAPAPNAATSFDPADWSATALKEAADKALYAAKSNGRDQARTAGPPRSDCNAARELPVKATVLLPVI